MNGDDTAQPAGRIVKHVDAFVSIEIGKIEHIRCPRLSRRKKLTALPCLRVRSKPIPHVGRITRERRLWRAQKGQHIFEDEFGL